MPVYSMDVSTPVTFRPASANDFEYCKRLYFDEMRSIIDEFKLDRVAQAASFEQQWEHAQVRILMKGGQDVGWMQAFPREDGLFLAQLFVEGAFQGRGIGTQAMHQIIADAAAAGQAVCLDVVKINRALRLYERLGFRVTGEEARKVYMRREPDEWDLPSG
jgi:ribosomal protein S18 acetylase RimI-like enzyme